jgi:lipid-A-disaccharide synthase
MKIALIAAEESGDALGGAVMAALRRARPDVTFMGVGGRAMTAQGIVTPFDISELSIIGLASIPAKLPTILRRIRETASAIVAARPDALVIIDSPDFTHRVARRVRKAAPGIPIINYAPPSVWAWRSGRARAMRAYVDEVLAILPFEPAAFARLNGPATTYVGHPLIERIAELRPDAEEARRRASDPPLVLVLPGSRRGEIKRFAATFGDALGKVAAKAGPLDVVLPTLPHIAQMTTEATATWPVRPRIITEPAEKYAAFRAARAALAKSGTVTLELALAQVPTAAGYRIAAWEAPIYRAMVRVSSVILPNLVIGENVVPELLQEEFTPDLIAGALTPLLGDTPERRRQLEGFAKLDAIMEVGGEAPSERAARAVLDVASRGRSPTAA